MGKFSDEQQPHSISIPDVQDFASADTSKSKAIWISWTKRQKVTFGVPLPSRRASGVAGNQVGTRRSVRQPKSMPTERAAMSPVEITSQRRMERVSAWMDAIRW
jgi:hypothetical protein